MLVVIRHDAIMTAKVGRVRPIYAMALFRRRGMHANAKMVIF